MRLLNKNAIFLSVVIIGGYTLVFLLSGFVEKSLPPLPESYADEDLALQGARLKGYSLGAEGLIADWYWMQSLQYLGNKIVKNPDTKISLDNLNALNPRLLYPYLDNATTLDPRFISAYEFGATVLPAIDKEKAIKLLEKGINENPNQWQLYQYLGYIYWRLGDYEKASDIYARGASVPNAPQFMTLMTAKTKTEGGSRETARAIYRQMFEQARDEQTKQTAELRLLQLDSLIREDVIRSVLQDFQSENQRCPNNWQEIFPLIRKARLPDGNDLSVNSESLAPVDPTEIPYVLERGMGKCNVRVDISLSKIPAI